MAEHDQSRACSPSSRLPHIKTIRKRRADGSERVHYYHRKTGRPIHGEPGTDAFLASYHEASRERAPSEPQLDVEWLIARYKASPEWAALAPASKSTRNSYFKRIIKMMSTGGVLLRDLDREDFIIPALYVWRDSMAALPLTADKALDSLRVVLAWAKKRRIIQHNWAREVERLAPVNRSRAEMTWTPELWDALLAAAAPDERQLLQFAAYSAARETDIARMLWAGFDGQWLTYTPQKTARKTGVVVQLPVHALPPFADLVAGLSRSTEFMLTTRTGQPWTTSNIKLRMRDLKVRAFPKGDPRRTFHDIRGTTISRLFNAGCTDAEVAAIDGHVIGRGSMLGRYAQRSRQLALNAYAKWRAAEFTQGGEVVPMVRKEGA